MRAISFGSRFVALLWGMSGALPGQTAEFTRSTPVSVHSVELNGPGSLVTADFNQDGIPDLAVGGFQAVVILLGEGNGEFRLSQSIAFSGQAQSPYDGDL